MLKQSREQGCVHAVGAACGWDAYELELGGGRRGYDTGVLVWKVRELFLLSFG